MATVNVYIDGLNLYNGALRDTLYRWLNLWDLSRALLKPDDDVQRIRYFTALVDRRFDPNGLRRQKAYIRALCTISGPVAQAARSLRPRQELRSAARQPLTPATT